MQIGKLRVLNYKGFKDSGWLEFPKGFTVVVGQNNSGKTALLESFRLSNSANKPHRSLSRDQATPLDPTSVVQVVLNVTGLELLQSALASQGQPVIPCPLPSANTPQIYLDQLFQRELIPLKLTAYPGSIGAREYPSLDFTPGPSGNHAGLAIQASQDRLSVRHVVTNPSSQDDIPRLAQETFSRTIYVFKAERLNIGRTKAVQASVLSPDGSNLAAVLMNLQSKSGERLLSLRKLRNGSYATERIMLRLLRLPHGTAT
jgi:hypothetical protein